MRREDVIEDSHHQCHGCGEDPILGPRYRPSSTPHKKKKVFCDLCYYLYLNDQDANDHLVPLMETNNDDDDDDDNYQTAIQQMKKVKAPRSSSTAAAHHHHDTATANSFFELLTILRLDRASNIDLHWNVSLYDPDIDVEETLCSAFAENCTIKTLAIYLRGTANINESIQVLVKALRGSPSIVSVTLSISPLRPPQQQQQHTSSSIGAGQALQSLLENSETLRFLSVRTLGRHSLDLQDYYNTNNKEAEEGGDDILTNYLFDGLAKSSSLRYFSFVGSQNNPTVSSISNQEKACRAIQSNPNLRRIDAVFADSSTRSSTNSNTAPATATATSTKQQLDGLMATKNQQWLEKWMGETSSQMERMSILEEILECCRYHDKTTAIYRFLRGQPRLILESLKDRNAFQ